MSCKVLRLTGGTTLDGTSKATEWPNSNFSSDCGEQKPSCLEEPSIKNFAKTDIESSRSRSHRHHRSRSLKMKHATSSNMDRFHRTTAALRCSGLLEIAQNVSQILRSNEAIQIELDKLRELTKEHSIQLHKQMQEKLEKEREASGANSEEGQILLTKLSQYLL
ncbi:hypothetical protein OS493_000971 [Desmophyllum pertusum]|uniref:Uncharacterized protein n=1 Tax=Desmophyllum pertusum TaxID=174260 RepID=A0A9W9ZTM8_9CNID|nr:hypothetical protein OS493_000971 [Desmophyllum pertusum]